MEEPITYVYAIIYETDIDGVWTDPKDAVRYLFECELTAEDEIELDGELITVEKKTEEMLTRYAEYPYLAKIKINPATSGEMWQLSR